MFGMEGDLDNRLSLIPYNGNLINSFVSSHIEFIFSMEVPWDMHQPHSLLLWLQGFHSKQKIPQ